MVAAVERGSVAERGGLRIGDVVLQVNDRPVVTRDAAREALAEASPERGLTLVLRREADRITLTLEPAQ
jgi:S1-C subfamily serine protease